VKISIFGLGYVGTVLTGCLSKEGHEVIGVDTEPSKVDLVNAGKSPIIEQDLDGLLTDGVNRGTIRATTDHESAVLASELSMICVGTPGKATGELDLTFVMRVCEHIGAALRAKGACHVVVVRSTMLPGSVEGTVIPTLERSSGRRHGADFGVVMNPEFLREGSAIKDFYNPPKTVVGAVNEREAELVAGLYAGLPGPLIKTSIKVAEMVKYADNIFHALKITFGNEIGTLCKRLGIDSQEVMRIFCEDRKLNISPAYLRPGFAYGGSCLPKDLRALNWLAKARDIEIPLLNSIAPGNEQQIKNALSLIMSKGCRRVGVLGFAFKGGTDDLRESPAVTVIEALLGKGYDLKLYDGHVSMAKLIGANRRFIEQHIPHLSRLMVESIDELIAHAELIVIGNESEEFFQVLGRLRPGQHVIDFTSSGRQVNTPASYERVTG
jgi:GDP-mannose 6-dehydrogenase